MNKRILLATWDGAGNVAPMLAIAQNLVRAGHEVRLMGPWSLKTRTEATGCRFSPFAHHADWDSTVVQDLTDESDRNARDLWFNPDLAKDVVAELDREPADLAVVDAMLVASIAAVQSRVPTVAVFHTAMSIFRGGPMHDFFSSHVPSFTAIHDACPLSVVTGVREFESDFPVPANVRFVGPILDGPGLGIAPDAAPELRAASNRALISLSSGFQDQLTALRQLADALAGMPVEAVITTGNAVDPADVPATGNVVVRGYVPHHLLLPNVSAVVTHGGLGTVMAALAQGLPLLCLPVGRDQFFNTAMVERLGVGRLLPADAGTEEIQSAIHTALVDEEMRTRAKSFASVIAGYPGLDGATHEIERLL